MNAFRCLSAAALSLVVFVAGPAVAAERLQITVGGELTQYFGYADNDGVGGGDFTGFDVKADGTLTFGGEVTLDTGVSVGLEVGLDAESTSDAQIDGSYLWAESGFGRIEIGSRDNVAVLMQYSAPDVGLGINDSDLADWIINPGSGDADSAFQSTYLYLGEDQATKISYYSPRIEGFQLGVSYIPEFERDNNAQPSRDLYRNGIAVGVNFVRSFGEVDVALAAGYLTAQKPAGAPAATESLRGYSFGGNIGYAGFTVGGSFADTKGSAAAGTDTSVSFDGRGYDIGVAYAFDPFQVSLSYYNGEVEDSTATAGRSKHETVMLSGNYEAGPGVNLLASVFQTRFRADTGVKNDGWAVVTGVTLSF